jgi:glutaconate CoA-transferase subunit A
LAQRSQRKTQKREQLLFWKKGALNFKEDERGFFEENEMTGKLIRMEEAVDLVNDGDMLAIGGYTLYRKPMAFIRALIRSGRKNMTVLSFAGSVDVDMMIGSGAVSTIRSCYVGMEYLGLAPNHRRWIENGSVHLIEESELTIGLGLKAALQRVPSMAVKQLLETDMLKVRKDIRIAACPLTSERVVALPAIKPDVAVIHVTEADPFGNACFSGNICADRELAMVSDRVILTAENIVSTEQLKQSPQPVQICNFEVDAVVEAPWGAHPTSAYPYYTFDMWHLFDYLEAGKGEDVFNNYLERYVFKCENEKDYLKQIGGMAALERILL